MLFLSAENENVFNTLYRDFETLDSRRLRYMLLLYDMWRLNDFKICRANGREWEMTWSRALRVLYAVTNIDFDRIAAPDGFVWRDRVTPWSRPHFYVYFAYANCFDVH